MFRRLIFNLWYHRKPPWDSGISPPELLDFIRTHPTGRAVDLGCGTGTNVITLACSGWQVTGVDFSPKAIRLAKQKLRSKNIQADIHVGDVTRLWDISDSYDLALDIGCFHSLTQRGKRDYLNQLDGILAPGGFWLLYSFLTSTMHQQVSPGIAEDEISIISSQLTLISRQDGFDKRERPSAWFLFKKNLILGHKEV
jgi:cyclopropane fatty-acyl-phospholipid synthase-like methyltransferase